jgi:signal transduction histidine kinase
VLVEDEGIGISEEDQKQLFTAFFRPDNQTSREAGGTGLGLVIAKSIAGLHGGDL